MHTPNINAEEAKTLLRDVAEPWQAFWFNHGAIAPSLRELSAALSSMTDEQFAYHVNGDRNDVAVWVNDVVGDAALSKKLRLLGSLSATQRTVAARVTELAAVAEPAPAAAVEAPAAAEAAPVKKAAKPAAKRTVKAKKAVAKAAPSPAPQKNSVWSKLLKRQ